MTTVAHLARMPAYVGFSRTHPDGLRARAAFDAGMRTLRTSGGLETIRAAWSRRLRTRDR